MSCCSDRDGRLDEGLVVIDQILIPGDIAFTSPKQDGLLGCLECESVGIGLELTSVSGPESTWLFQVEQSVDGRSWAVTDTLYQDTVPGGDKVVIKVRFVPRMPRVRIRGMLDSGGGQVLWVKAYATRTLNGVAEAPAPEPEDPEAMARQLVTESLMVQPKVMEALRQLARQTLAEERSARALAERRNPQPRLVLDKMLNSNIVTALSDCEHEVFLGDYDRLALFVEAVPTALTGAPTITISRLASLDGRSFFTAQTLNAGVSLPAAGLFLHTGSVSPGAGRGRISVTIAAGGGSWTGRIRIWATPWFEEDEASEHPAGSPARPSWVHRATGVCRGSRTGFDAADER